MRLHQIGRDLPCRIARTAWNSEAGRVVELEEGHVQTCHAVAQFHELSPPAPQGFINELAGVKAQLRTSPN